MVINQVKFISGEQETFLWDIVFLGRENGEILCYTFWCGFLAFSLL